MLTLSIRQPWAWLILRPDIVDPAARLVSLGRDIKDVENRTRRTKVRGRVLIHASKTMTRAEYTAGLDTAMVACRSALSLPAFEDLPRGGIVGSAEIVDCVEYSRSPWFYGPWGYVLRDARPLPFIPCLGQLGFFEVPDTLLAGAP